MADGSGWTAIPNDLLDTMGNLGNAELRVLLALYRKTVGYQKDYDRVSVSQIAAMTGLTSRNAQVALTSLLAAGYICRQPAGKQAYAYSVKPYPLGTRLDHIPSDNGSETISPRDTEPYPLRTRLEDKPYPLGITQKKDIKKERKTRASAADAATRAPRSRTSSDPQSPPSVRAAIADACSIDLNGRTASRAQVLQVNQQAAKLWKAAQAAGKDEGELLLTLGYVAGWVRSNVYPFSGGQPLTPAAITERWRAAIDARDKRERVNGAHYAQPAPPAADVLTPEQVAEAARKLGDPRAKRAQ